MLLYIILFLLFGLLGFNYFVSNKYKIVLFKYKSICLGSLKVNEITLLEWKPLFSLKTFYFNKGQAQEIFHTHSFSAYSFLLYGNYMESFYDENKGIWEEPRNRSRLIFIPRDRFHQITKSEGCRTIMLTGPWGDEYREYKDDTKEIIISTHGRKEIQRMKLNV
jgi:hypothetical protein